jgi:predicted DsbA family dithiol-disulfide isomerase
VCAVALWRGLGKWDPPAALAPRGIAAALLVPAIAAPLVVGFRRPIVVPDVIARELSAAPAGEVTVIDFVDFECPFCRMTNAALSPILAAHRDHIHLVRKQVPLTRMHEHALDAARASCCGERLGKGDAMADALFSAPVDDLTVDGCAKLAVSLGLDETAFRSCTQDPAVDARIQADSADFKAAEGHGLPTLWVGQRKIEGAQPAEVLERAITKAIDGRS